jgi:hypothetical protein
MTVVIGTRGSFLLAADDDAADHDDDDDDADHDDADDDADDDAPAVVRATASMRRRRRPICAGGTYRNLAKRVGAQERVDALKETLHGNDDPRLAKRKNRGTFRRTTPRRLRQRPALTPCAGSGDESPG